MPLALPPFRSLASSPTSTARSPPATHRPPIVPCYSSSAPPPTPPFKIQRQCFLASAVTVRLLTSALHRHFSATACLLLPKPRSQIQPPTFRLFCRRSAARSPPALQPLTLPLLTTAPQPTPVLLLSGISLPILAPRSSAPTLRLRCHSSDARPLPAIPLLTLPLLTSSPQPTPVLLLGGISSSSLAPRSTAPGLHLFCRCLTACSQPAL